MPLNTVTYITYVSIFRLGNGRSFFVLETGEILKTFLSLCFSFPYQMPWRLIEVSSAPISKFIAILSTSVTINTFKILRPPPPPFNNVFNFLIPTDAFSDILRNSHYQKLTLCISLALLTRATQSLMFSCFVKLASRHLVWSLGRISAHHKKVQSQSNTDTERGEASNHASLSAITFASHIKWSD
jgi:hypothetical protein